MPWVCVSIDTVAAQVDGLSDQLAGVGALAVTVRPGCSVEPVLEPGPAETPVWDSARLEALFPVAADLSPLLLGAGSVLAVDYDPQALLATRANAAYNDVLGDRLSVTDTLPAVGCYDLVVANILANPLVDLAGRLNALRKTEGVVILSGILEAKLDTVLAAYPELKFAPANRREGWICVEGTRRSG